MNETRGQLKSDIENQKSAANPSLVEINRTFRAPVERVWEAWSQPELFKQWWGPEEFTSPRAEMDFREGGKFIFGMQSPQGEITWSVGTVTEIKPNQKIVFSETFGNEQGDVITPKEAGMPNWPGEYHGTITVEFEKLDADLTKMSIHHTGIPAQMHDDCVEGWKSSFNKLQQLLERH